MELDGLPKMGVCQLTGAYGRYVRAHIIPAALTKPASKGKPYLQGGEGSRPIRRWTSWYDEQLVTAEGEEILSDYDHAGINELRRLKLIWSSWESDDLRTADMLGEPTAHGLRIIEGADGKALRLFFLSILWRAAATALPEFRPIRLRQRESQLLRDMLLRSSPDPQWLFPTVLAQFSTRGPWHNQTPLAGRKPIEREGRKPAQVRIFRFFFDGLAVHFHRDRSFKQDSGMGAMRVGADKGLGVITLPFEDSFQRENLELAIAETRHRWPREFERLTRANP